MGKSMGVEKDLVCSWTHDISMWLEPREEAGEGPGKSDGSDC